jgi:hypothetical protein
MGGYGSGRSGGRPTTDSGLTLSLSKLLDDRLFRPGCAWGGSLVWTNTTTGERVGSISYEAHLGQESGRVRLKYTTTRWDGERRESDYWIQLETRLSPSAADDGGSYALGQDDAPPNSTCPMAPSPSHRAKPTSSHTPASANPPMTGLCGVLSSCGTSSGQRAASAITSENPSGCAGEPTSAPWRESTRRKRPWKLTPPFCSIG